MILAGFIVVVCLGAGWILYAVAGKSNADYGVKLADLLVQGALITVFFAILKAVIDAQRHALAEWTRRSAASRPAGSSQI
jgi:hypothetical protein